VTDTAPCISDFALDLLIAADLSVADERRARAHLGECAGCRARLSERESERESFNRAGPALVLPERAPPRARPRAVGRSSAAALAGAALLVLVVAGVRGFRSDEPARRSELGVKGSDPFELYIRHGDTIRKAGDHELVHPGDQLQFSYTSTEDGYVGVLSLDGAGVSNVYFPDGARMAWRASAGREQLLPASTILDDVPGHELVHALFCATPIELTPLAQELARARTLSPPEGCVVRTIELDKQALR
jgi:hypothetical protein